MGKDASKIRREIAETRERMGDTVEAIGYKADVPARVRDSVNDKVETVKETIGNAVDTVREQVGNATGIASHAACSAKGNVQDRVDTIRGNVGDVDVQESAKRAVSMAAENPLGVALGALAIGFLAGMLVPMSDTERVQAGKIRTAVAERAETAIDETISAGHDIVEEAVQTAVSSAQKRGSKIAQHALHPENAA